MNFYMKLLNTDRRNEQVTYYIKRLHSGIAEIYAEKPKVYDFVVDAIPEGTGPIMVTKNGKMYRKGSRIFGNENQITDHEILMTLLGVNE